MVHLLLGVLVAISMPSGVDCCCMCAVSEGMQPRDVPEKAGLAFKTSYVCRLPKVVKIDTKRLLFGARQS